MRTRLALAVLLAVSSAALAAAPTSTSEPAASEPAASAPATAPAKLDLSTPASALKSLASATRSGDAKQMLATLNVTDTDKDAAGVLAEFVAASARVEKAARDKFGKDAEKFFAAKASPIENLAASATEPTVKGDTATMPLKEAGPGAPKEVVLRKSGEEWKIDARSVLPLKDADFAKQLPTLRAMIETLDGLSADIRAGKFATAKAAFQAAQQRVLATTPTQPSTQSTTSSQPSP